MKRIVITGMGVISPLGCGVAWNWERLIASQSGVRAISEFSVVGLQSKIAGTVPRGSGDGEFDPEALFSGKEIRRNDLFILYALAAADEALAQSGWSPNTEADRARTGVIVGSGFGGFQTIVAGASEYERGGEESVPAFFIPAQLSNLASGQLAIRHGFFGPNYAVASACAAGAEAIAAAARSIIAGEADVMIAGAADATVHPLCIAGFDRMRALSTGFNDVPSEASRPFDRRRDGFVVAEGAGVVVLEEQEHARRRDAEMLAELRGFASASDGYHVAASHPEGLGERRAMTLALDRASLRPDEVDYLNAHAASTQIGDGAELAAIRAVFGAGGKPAVSSTKSATGHCMGAAGALEAVYTICALRSGVVPPTLNLDRADEGYESMNLVAKLPQERALRVALSNSFGFGATKVALVFALPGDK